MNLLDTCTLLWWTLDPEKLSAKAGRACDRIEQDGAFISSITIWEIGIKLKKGVLQFNDSLEGYVHRLDRLGTIEVIPVDEKIWMENLNLDWGHRDPVDRTIVATAKLRGLSIITKDRIIREYYPHVIWM